MNIVSENNNYFYYCYYHYSVQLQAQKATEWGKGFSTIQNNVVW